jgi:hypothetical protein
MDKKQHTGPSLVVFPTSISNMGIQPASWFLLPWVFQKELKARRSIY